MPEILKIGCVYFSLVRYKKGLSPEFILFIITLALSLGLMNINTLWTLFQKFNELLFICK